jgi:hypothetical protein
MKRVKFIRLPSLRAVCQQHIARRSAVTVLNEQGAVRRSSRRYRLTAVPSDAIDRFEFSDVIRGGCLTLHRKFATCHRRRK